MKITAIESFNIEIPITEQQEQLRYCNKTGVTRIRTDEGITGYGWAAVDAETAETLLVGKDPLQVERHVAEGLGHAFYGAENALWDIVGKAFGQPLHKLWGHCRDEMRLYLTTVWAVDAHVKALRRKLEGAGGSPGLLETVRGVGYRLRDEPVEA